ncbi:hypothetical protein [Polaribacter aquimarinus]|uniref:PsbP C-terminal domain-containing protein n=1 Tax=Polaribacter aquimarinus TaxID=2100726 RepID=A0A2U2J7V9_9FLAO|nr:hypothetical protein [Polaribacter aquimarinus]PWG04433.1 hypothetical protein DIS07_13595 [Polaribacter aquimarinus]
MKQSELGKELQCKSFNFDNLELVKDVENKFSIAIPKNWKTNLYQDNLQSSIFFADTTKQLTATFLVDVSFIKNNLEINDLFKLKIEQENLKKKLIQINSKELIFLEKPTYILISKGIKSDYLYQKLQAFIKIDKNHFILAKAEVYGDSLTQNRLCKAISLIEKIKIIQ